MPAALQDLGFVPFFAQQASIEAIEQGRVGRVIEVQRSLIRVSDGAAERAVPVTSSWQGVPSDQRPTVGDWVVLDETQTRVERVLDRKSLFRRVAAGDRAQLQPIAANVDILFIVTSCNDEFKESRLERYLALAADAGVMPVVVLTKIDLSDGPDAFVERARRVQAGVAVEKANSLDASTLGGVAAWIERGTTVALVGSSGVGKSTLLNGLAGQPIAATQGVREDDQKGRHTTTYRSLHPLPGGGLVIDVPGMRELKIAEVDAGLSAVFDDIEAIAAGCRFADCRHESEPGCAVREAVENGKLEARRLQNYHKLLRENARNSASLAEKRSQGRAFARYVKRVKAMKEGKRSLD